jgi:alkylation response protein AidB-like acyl-CoA dehydrogenase
MFELAPSEEQAAVIETLRGYAKEELRPAAKPAEQAKRVPAAIASELQAMGVTVPVPETMGGQGVPDLLTHLMVAEELAWGDPGIAYALLQSAQVGLMIAQCGSEEQRRRVLPRLTRRDPAPTSVLLYEGFGRSPSEMDTRARRHTDSTWILAGEKIAVANPALAEVSVVVAKRDDTDELAAFVLDGWPAGIRVTRDDRECGKIGLTSAHTGSVAFDRLVLDESARLAGGGPLDLARLIARVRLTVPALAIGCARAAIELATRYATERIAFGRPIAAFQGVAFLIVDASMAIDSARLELWAAAGTIERSRDPDSIERSTNRVVARACEVALQATRDSVQVFGGHGFITDYPVERWYRAAGALAAIDFDPLASAVSFV